MILTFAVEGVPEPQGSVKALPACRMPRTFRTVHEFLSCVNLTSDNNALKSWRARVAFAAHQMTRQHGHDVNYRQIALWPAGPVFVRLVFTFPQPASLRGKELGARRIDGGRDAWPCVRPDIDKLARGVLDALTGVLWADDGQVCELALEKHYIAPGAAETGGLLVDADNVPLEP